MKDKKELILNRMREIYAYYQKEYNNENATRYWVSDLNMDKYALKVLLDIYTYDDESEEENRYIYHDWDLCEFVINEILSQNPKNDKNGVN